MYGFPTLRKYFWQEEGGKRTEKDTSLEWRFPYRQGIRSKIGGLALSSKEDFNNPVRFWDVHRMVN